MNLLKEEKNCLLNYAITQYQLFFQRMINTGTMMLLLNLDSLATFSI